MKTQTDIKIEKNGRSDAHIKKSGFLKEYNVEVLQMEATKNILNEYLGKIAEKNRMIFENHDSILEKLNSEMNTKKSSLEEFEQSKESALLGIEEKLSKLKKYKLTAQKIEINTVDYLIREATNEKTEFQNKMRRLEAQISKCTKTLQSEECKIKGQRRTLQQKLNAETEKVNGIIDSGYPIISLDFLKEKKVYTQKEDKYDTKYSYLPKFGFFKYDNPRMELESNTGIYGDGSFRNFIYPLWRQDSLKQPSNIPKFINNLLLSREENSYNNLEKMLERFLGNTRSHHRGVQVSIAEFYGLLPKVVVQDLKKAKKIFGEDLYFISEIENWSTTVRTIPKKDPLLIGVLRELNKAFYITSFNTTPLEEVIKNTYVGTQPRN